MARRGLVIPAAAAAAEILRLSAVKMVAMAASPAAAAAAAAIQPMEPTQEMVALAPAAKSGSSNGARTLSRVVARPIHAAAYRELMRGYFREDTERQNRPTHLFRGL
jgi:hypothetical protein